MVAVTRPSSSGRKLKKFALIGLAIIVIFLALYVLLWYRGIMNINQQAGVAIPKAEKYDSLRNTVANEQDRCKRYVANGSGEFGQFEYCKRFLEWSSKLPL